MQFSYNWLQTFFDAPLPSPAEIEEQLTFHSSEVEEVVRVGDDTTFEVKVLPDKSAWLLSHRGLAKELSVIFDIPMKQDPLRGDIDYGTALPDVRIVLDTPVCDFYGAAVIEGVTVGPSPDWLRARLVAIGQRSINNIVDATNYVMFELGQPLHAFDAETFAKDASGQREVKVTSAVAGETFTTLSHEDITLTSHDAVITDGVSGEVLALAGIKGGLNSGVTEQTATILLEAAHFDRVATRLGAQRHKLPTDAAKRYENGLSRSVTPYGLVAGAKLIAEIAGGTIRGMTTFGDSTVTRPTVTVTVSDINRVLGIAIAAADVSAILTRFGYAVVTDGESFTVTPPHERDDIEVKQDLIEEIGRMYGLAHIVSVPPQPAPVQELNARHYYAEQIRTILVSLGFSEVYTSSFRNQDIAHIKNALASDKSYLRSRLKDNLLEVRQRNIPFRDLLGLSAVQVFEIGTVFDATDEAFHIGLAVQTGNEYKAKVDDVLLRTAVAALEAALAVTIAPVHTAPGYIEFSLEALLKTLPQPTAYVAASKSPAILYKAFSLYPSVSRDIAMWVTEGTDSTAVEDILKNAAGDLLVRLTHLDTFTKEGRTSLAFRLVFQSKEKTLDGTEIDELMTAVYSAVAGQGWEVR
ncbi:MAG: phenylalanine--tRNA ligase subunit beta [Candidatus Pacebacteria bacterium]|jgi:phenylalanyl-tRNA synthetase beta chain|nr:phenylalanine--tRNA ligase subunit beta [Candidatus Paceibacterota bacterium]